jgi:rieske iron-sulfur protein
MAMERRKFVVGLGGAVAWSLIARADPEDERPQEGDVLVAVDGTGLVPLTPADIALGERPTLAWPMDATTGTVRSGSRLNKVLLLRLDPSTLDEITRGRAAEGIVGYSAICPHAGCEVTGWLVDSQTLECPCHTSHYNPRQKGAVIDGPTQRPLPALPLKIEADKIVVAKPFSTRPGIIQS